MGDALRVAVVGTGAWWGREHARVWATRPDAELVAVVGRSPEKSEARAAEFGGRPYTDIAEMLEEEAPDLVSLCLPNEAHFEPTLQVIEAGFPLLVEKPLVFEMSQADRLLAEAERRGLFFAINFNHRYARPVEMARAAVAAGDLGQIVFATWRFGGEVGTSAHPYANLIETQCHGFDMLEYLCGPIGSVSAEMTDMTGRGYSTMAVSMTLLGGGVASLVGSYDSSYAYPGTHYLELNGAKGRIVIEDTVASYSYSRAGDEMRAVWSAGYFNDAGRSFHAMFERYLDDMVPAFREGRPPPVHARAGRRALELALACMESHSTGHRITTL